jgi:hypothetical protein
MTELEKAKKLLELFIEYKHHYYTGLCCFLQNLYEANIIEWGEYRALNRFITVNDPKKVKTRVWYSLFKKTKKSLYYFEVCCYWRRLRWLKFLVKKYKKIELKSKTL